MPTIRPLEKTGVNRMLVALKARGAWAEKTHGSAMQTRGLPDILGVYRVHVGAMAIGVTFAIEAKRTGVKGSRKNIEAAPEYLRVYVEQGATELQAYHLYEIAQRNGFVAVCQTVEEALAVLDRIDAFVREAAVTTRTRE